MASCRDTECYEKWFDRLWRRGSGLYQVWVYWLGSVEKRNRSERPAWALESDEQPFSWLKLTNLIASNCGLQAIAG
jgi:hypothetical protein